MISNTPYNDLYEIDGLSDSPTATYAMVELCKEIREDYGRIYKMPINTFIFNGVISDRYPGDFSRLIKRAKLGDVIQSNAKVNPNSDNVIRVYIWNVDKKALSKWFAKHKTNRKCP